MKVSSMAESTGIGWTDHTANFWWGCQRVSPGCEHCYAETLAVVRRRLPVWGPPSTTERQRKKGVWSDVVKWNAAARREGVRRRVFVSSMADVFEAHPMVVPWRAEALDLLALCDGLDVQLLTKRPENIRKMVPTAWLESWPAHVWVGTTVEDQRRANERIPHLLNVPARVRFLSCEPLLEAVDLDPPLCPYCPGEIVEGEHGPWCVRCDSPPVFGNWLDACADEKQRGINWVIVGGESGPGARPFDLAWARSIVAQCDAAGVPAFVKQLGAQPVDSAKAAVHQPCIHERKPAIRTTIYAADAPEVAQARIDERNPALRLAAPQVEHPLHIRSHFCLDDRSGADPAEWPKDLRRQSFPEVSHVG
jgi:protein gp37